MTDPRPVRVLLVGSGGREHALAWKLAQSPLVERILVVPGNGGTAGAGEKVQNIAHVSPADFAGLLDLALKEDVNLLVPGPEDPLVNGITDYFKQHGPARISVFGPSRAAARMEGSKAFSKDFMKRHNIPTATFEIFSEYADAKAYLDAHREMRVVIKASGLAGGKGVLLPETHEEACAGISSIMRDHEFGSAGDSVVIEEYLEGEEISILSFSDGYTIRSLPVAQDHKRVNDGDQGLNTGGMGCYAPTAVATPAIMEQIHRTVLQPTIDGMRNEGYPFVGCLFTGFMLTETGPKLLEYNVRFGDPESQTLLPLLETDLAQIMLACTNHHLSSICLKIRPSFSTTVVVAAGGYPSKYEQGTPMTVQSPSDQDTVHFHAGTSLNGSSLITSGGRVIAATSVRTSIRASTSAAYAGVDLITFDRMHYRTDIAYRELARSTSNPSTTTPTALTYASAGVSVSEGNKFVNLIKRSVASTARPGCASSIGGFGGDISLPAAGYGSTSPTIIGAIDGVGTKLLLYKAVGTYAGAGIDLVAMNVNDIVVTGGEPLAFLDYFACGRLEADVAGEFVDGVAEGCRRAGCGLIGGETAEMPGVYKVERGDFDAAGVAIGALGQGRRMLPLMEEMVEGDVLLGLGSSGVHSNGFSLVRKIVGRSGLSLSEPAPWRDELGRAAGEALLEPTRIYVKSLLAVLNRSGMPVDRVKGMAHITGGGLIDNIPRMLPKHLAAEVQVGSWPVLGVLKWLKREGRLEHREFATTFNTGLGMVLVVEAAEVEAVMEELRAVGEKVYRVGALVKREGGGEGCVLKNLEAWDAL